MCTKIGEHTYCVSTWAITYNKYMSNVASMSGVEFAKVDVRIIPILT